MKSNPVILALDLPTPELALAMVDRVKGVISNFKVGHELFTAAGPELVRRLRQQDLNVFLDLKFHDIPNTVAKAVASATRLGVQMLTIHTSGGSEMMKAAEESAQQTALQAGVEAPLVLGVTVLTSMDQSGLAELGVAGDLAGQVERLATLAQLAGLRGLVCSPLEIARLRQILPGSFQLVTPGIRAANDAAGDQRRILSGPEAMAAGASWLVVGRPIYAATDPLESAQRLVQSLA